MAIAEEIYSEVKTLPDDLAREVLDFVHFIENRYALRQNSETIEQPPIRRRTPGSAKGKLQVLVEDEAHLDDFQGYMP
ncbi:DUF2281 domain-containing protein [Ectothiorhodospiraceae bacterium BW-2]|nr:DUF2281 domain-containing protein [Ectothiorhodospiraceae bacterium BW-2]